MSRLAVDRLVVGALLVLVPTDRNNEREDSVPARHQCETAAGVMPGRAS